MLEIGRARRRFLVVLLVVVALGAVLPSAAAAAGDLTPPLPATGQKGVEFWDFDRVKQRIDVRLTFVDPESGVASVLISCDGGPEASYPYASHVFVPALDPAAGGCGGYGQRSLQARAVNGDGAISLRYQATVSVGPTFTLEYPLPATTGQPFTVHVHYSAGFVPAPGEICRWEVRWGSVPALRDNAFDETFGGMLFEGPASQGYCGDWTFTLPWVPEPRFEFNLSMESAADTRSGTWPDRNLLMAQVAGTDRRIRESSLPIVQVLPNTYTPIVGQPITYTRYLIGGATACCGARWTARLGSGQTPIVWERSTTSPSFTITPPTSGVMFVGWDRMNTATLLAAYYDPPVRYRDRMRPTTTVPIQRIGGAVLGPTVPVTMTWTGSDRGWGIASYVLQQSINGGAWQMVRLPSARATSVVRLLTPGVAVRFRVRATDKAHNIGAWAYGPTFRPRVAEETSTAIAYAGPWLASADPTAHGGSLRESSAANARATFRFTGRDVAWFADRGPGHGRAKVFVDGVLIATVDLHAAADAPRLLVFRRHWIVVGTHTLRVIASGTGVVDVDAFVVVR